MQSESKGTKFKWISQTKSTLSSDTKEVLSDPENPKYDILLVAAAEIGKNSFIPQIIQMGLMFKSTVLSQTRSKHKNETVKRTDCIFYQFISQLHSSFLVTTLLPGAAATEDAYPSESGLHLLHGLSCPAYLTSPLSSAFSPIFLGQDKTGMIDR